MALTAFVSMEPCDGRLEKQALQVRLYRDEASALIYPAGEYVTEELCISAAKECGESGPVLTHTENYSPSCRSKPVTSDDALAQQCISTYVLFKCIIIIR